MASIFTIFIHDIPLEFFKKLEDAGFEVESRVSKDGVIERYHYTSDFNVRSIEIFFFSKSFTIDKQSLTLKVEESEYTIPKVSNIHIRNIPLEFLERLKQAGLVTHCEDGSYAITIDDDIKLSFQETPKESKER